MANYVYNIVNIAFPSESEKEAAKAVLLKEGEFDFNHIIPMPESLNIEDGSVTQHAAVYVARETGMLERGRFETLPEKAKTCLQKFLRFSDKTGLTLWKYANAVEYRGRLEDVKQTKDEARKAIIGYHSPKTKAEFDALGETALSNAIYYGAPTWYDWCKKNWGTKWNAGEVSTSESVTELDISFETAYNEPAPIFEKMSQMLPNATISVAFANEEIGSGCGERVYKGGKIIEGDEGYMPYSKESVEFACAIWGYDPEDYLDDEDEEK